VLLLAKPVERSGDKLKKLKHTHLTHLRKVKGIVCSLNSFFCERSDKVSNYHIFRKQLQKLRRFYAARYSKLDQLENYFSIKLPQHSSMHDD